MKHAISLFLALIMLCTLFGCGKEPTYQEPLSFYYRSTDLSYDAACVSVVSETREGAGLNTTEDILALYFNGPESTSLSNPFPAGLRLVSCNLEEKTLYLTVSKELASLTGMDLTLACSCITLTCLSIVGAEEVCIQAEGAKLGGQTTITMDRDSILLLDTSD